MIATLRFKSQLDNTKGRGNPLPSSTGSFMNQAFGVDFSTVRIHTDSRAADMNRSIHARAFTHGKDIYFNNGEYNPGTALGRRLLAHELTHVVQQTGHMPPKPDKAPVDKGLEKQKVPAEVDSYAQKITQRARGQVLQRASPQAVAGVLRRGRVAGSGIQFYPVNVTDTQVGPTSGRSGNRLHVIIGENLTIRDLARQILPLWTTATPFTPPGASSPNALDIITEDELARGLLHYNRYFLQVPGMSQWRAGLIFPLPVIVDTNTGIATLHPLIIRNLASSFDADWLPLLDAPASTSTAANATVLSQQATDFLASHSDSASRGIALMARVLRNPRAERAFFEAVFRQLGGSAFEVALEFMSNLINREFDLIAIQRDGAAIFNLVRLALASPPATITSSQQSLLDRANRMLGRMTGTTPQNPPAAAPQRPIELRPANRGNPCACLVFIHNNERNARAAAERLHQSCRFNLAIVRDSGGRLINIPGTGARDPNQLFPTAIQNECTRNEAGCRTYIAGHNDLRSRQMEFFLTIKTCSHNFRLPVVALHNNQINDTATFRRALPRLGSRATTLSGQFERGLPATDTRSREELRRRLGRLRGSFRNMMTVGGSTNIFRWCNLPEVIRCNVGDPQRPDHVIWTTNSQDFNDLSRQNANVVLQQGLGSAGASGSESATDLSTLFLRVGPNARFINIETPHTRSGRLDSSSIQQSNLTFIQQMLGHLNLNCCDNQQIQEETT